MQAKSHKETFFEEVLRRSGKAPIGPGVTGLICAGNVLGVAATRAAKLLRSTKQS